MRLPILADEIIREGAFDAGEAKDGFGVVRGHGVPETPEIFEDGVTFAVEESVLQAVGFVAGEAVGDVDHVARFEPARLADHRSEGIRNIFPGDPVVPAEGAAAERVIANLELWFKSQRVAGSHGSILEIG